MALVFATAFGYEQWWKPVEVTLYVYYFTFLANLFVKLYQKENWLTKLFFSTTKMPLYVASLFIALVILVLQKQHPKLNFNSAYLNAVIGSIATTVGYLRRGNLQPRKS